MKRLIEAVSSSRLIAALVAASILQIASVAVADEPAPDAYREETVRHAPPTPRAALDHRLPPVLPGETLDSGDGTKMKVWSTAGSVGEATAPTAGSAPVLPEGLGVIVDTHRDDWRHGDHRGDRDHGR